MFHTFTYKENDEMGYSGWVLDAKPYFDPVSGRGVAHDVLEEMPHGGEQPHDELIALGAPLIPVNMGAVMSTARQAMSIAYVHVRSETDPRNGEPTGNIRIYGYLRNLKRRGELSPSFELTVDQDTAKALADSLLAQTK